MIANRFLLATLALSLGASTLAAQSDARFDGDWTLAVDGTVIMGLHLTQGSGGILSGTVQAGGKTLPVSGSIRDGRATFVTGMGDGGYLHWDARPTEQGTLAVALAPSGADGKADPSLAQQHVLTRRSGGGSGGISQAAQQWIVRLAAVADSITVWCASPSFRESDICVKSLQILKRVAPALMVARLTTGGQAASLLRVLASGPGSSGSASAIGSTPSAANGDMFAALLPPPASAEPPAPVPGPSPSESSRSVASGVGRSLASGATGGSAPSAAPFTGEWVLYVDGTEIAVVQFDPAASAGGSSAAGTISVFGDAKAFSGSVIGGALEFPFTAVDGTPTQWRVVPRGGRLSVTISGANGTQQQTLERRGGWSETAALAQQWARALQGRSLTRTTRTNGGASGGATTDFVMNFCPASVLLTETRSVVSVNVPGAGGSQTSRDNDRGSWHAVSRGDVAALVITTKEGTMQFGLRHGDGETIYVVQDLVRLGPARCQ